VCVLRHRPAGADQPEYDRSEYDQAGCDGCATVLRNGSLVACGDLCAWCCDVPAMAGDADAAISAIATVLKTILRMIISSAFRDGAKR
jgi:hypothetical protein